MLNKSRATSSHMPTPDSPDTTGSRRTRNFAQEQDSGDLNRLILADDSNINEYEVQNKRSLLDADKRKTLNDWRS